MNHRLLLIAGVLLLPAALPAAEPKVLFEDRFDGKLADGWTWLRENPKAWRLREGALEIRVEPGGAGTVKNALVRKAPDRSKSKYAFEVTVTALAQPTRQYEQAGLTLYHDGTPVFKLVKERVDGQLYIVAAPNKVLMPTDTVQLRLVVAADNFEAQYRTSGKGAFKTVTKGKLPAPGNDEISVQCYNGPPDAEHWFRFENFRVLKLDE
jgi:regulation of enolase protein 1 (concanavalin A-like superfamily)